MPPGQSPPALFLLVQPSSSALWPGRRAGSPRAACRVLAGQARPASATGSLEDGGEGAGGETSVSRTARCCVMTPPPQERAAMASGCAADNCRRHPSQGSQGGSLGQAPCTWRRSLRPQPPVCVCRRVGARQGTVAALRQMDA